MALNTEQAAATDAIMKFLPKECRDNFFLLRGSAGTGKTYCIQDVAQRYRGRIVFTAPTNKATKVLRETLTKPDYKPDCRTIYSLLGLTLTANGEVKELSKPDEDADISSYPVVVVDEAYMVNSQLCHYIREAVAEHGTKFIFMGDPAQLPPVKEFFSPVGKMFDQEAELTQVMRFDNQILKLAITLRGQVDHPAPTFKRYADNDGVEGIWDLSEREFLDQILDAAGKGRFSQVGEAKATAWRNVTVDSLNNSIRRRIFDNAFETFWLPDDRIVCMEPAKDLEGETIAMTADEGRVVRVDVDYHPVWKQYKCWRLSVCTDENKTISLWALHQDAQRMFERYSEELAGLARGDRRRWKDFWEFKEAFHKVRHGYAGTVHGLQGSTYNAVFVDWRDILLNRNRSEAFRCLYVACTRARKELYLGG